MLILTHANEDTWHYRSKNEAINMCRSHSQICVRHWHCHKLSLVSHCFMENPAALLTTRQIWLITQRQCSSTTVSLLTSVWYVCVCVYVGIQPTRELHWDGEGQINPLGGPGAKISCGPTQPLFPLLSMHWGSTKTSSRDGHVTYTWQLQYFCLEPVLEYYLAPGSVL